MNELINPGHDAVRFEPPRDITPAVAALLLSHREEARIISAIVLDLASRGWFSIETYSGGWALRSSHVLPGRGTLHPYETLLLDRVFTPSLTQQTGENLTQQYVSLTTFKHRVTGHTRAITESVATAMVSDGLATRNSLTTSRLRGKPWTPAGETAREQAIGFRKYLEKAETGQLINASQHWQVERYLGFAVAFDIAARWVHSLEPAAQTVIANPFIVGALAGAQGGFTMDTLFTADVTQSYLDSSAGS